MSIYNDVGTIKGVGEKTRAMFAQCGINNILDLLLYFPRDYEKANVVKDDNLLLGEMNIIPLIALEIQRDYRKNNKTITTVIFSHNNIKISAKWFNQPYMKNKFKLGQKYVLEGKIEKFKNIIYTINPKIVTETNGTEQVIKPKYHLKGKINDNIFRKTILQVMKNIRIKENLPEDLVKKYNLCSLDTAIRNIHNPINETILEKSLERLKFQEMFTYCLKVNILKEYLNKSTKGIYFNISPEIEELKKSLPFELTNAQNNVLKEILKDQQSGLPMNRLIQGDVGSGKTIVAIIALLNAVKNGYQVAFMAPTEILAQQHYNEVTKILDKFQINTEILTSSVAKRKKENIKDKLAKGEIQIIVGTHSLIQEDVQFKNIGLVIVDEQHRFGVLQRNKLNNKGKNIDVMVMSATPIPRTLSLTLYGDLDVSTIDQLPPGRQKIETYAVNRHYRDRVYKFALNEVKSGRQVYIVCPLVEKNETSSLCSVEGLYEELKEKYFSGISLGLLHGKMNNKDKEEIMQKYKEGDINILICTTVVEVGVNVPNATLMIVENAERYGLAQLHQLRGRVGRGSYKSYCILIADGKSEKTKKRMDIMKNSNDGFYIAEEDLKIRGSGELFGFRQHGENGFLISDIFEDIDIFKKALLESKKFFESKEDKDMELREKIIKSLEETAKYICFN
ncbi:ATP-dependent DNA helicase RecG [Haloimpatiens lingqiaonensis]|uniref:ATP-dependent DNA helicase RecG n=1 Tax=Haloimpatiens lingqiaonensis TaxID=1380675 RepID=UPI0010FD2702|nr:ATP-dependent DNA helicase RecG [Haloimpatiens lingqiaonensis]